MKRARAMDDEVSPESGAQEKPELALDLNFVPTWARLPPENPPREPPEKPPRLPPPGLGPGRGPGGGGGVCQRFLRLPPSKLPQNMPFQNPPPDPPELPPR